MAEIIFEINNGIAFVTLNRPEKLNAFNRPMALLLQEKLTACKDAAVRCVYLTGTGKGFCAGQDLEEIPGPTGPGMNRILKEAIAHETDKKAQMTVEGRTPRSDKNA